MNDEVFHRTVVHLDTLSEIYRNISGGPHISTKSLTQLTDMIADLIDYLSTTAKGQV